MTDAARPSRKRERRMQDRRSRFRLGRIGPHQESPSCAAPAPSWNQWAGEEVAILTDPGQGQVRKILSNTATTLTLDSPWGDTPDGESEYVIRTGAASVWVSWGFTDPTQNNGRLIAVRAAPVDGLGNFGSLQAKVTIDDSLGGEFADPKVGPTGQLLVTYQTDVNAGGVADIKVALKEDGMGSKPFLPSTRPAQTLVGLQYAIPAQPQRPVDSEPTLAWDLSGLHHPGSDGRVYLVYTGANATNHDDTYIAVRYSNDSGKTWSDVQQVNDHDPNSQFLPAAAVDPTTGWLAVSWYDARNDKPGNIRSEIYATVSDGVLHGSGAPDDPFHLNFLTPNVQVAAQPSNAAASGDAFGFGDYTGLAFYNKTFFPVWADNSNSTGNNPGPRTAAPPSGPMDVYTAEVDVTMAQPQAPANAPPAPSGGAAPAASLDAQPIASSVVMAAEKPRDTAPRPDGSPAQTADTQSVIVSAASDSTIFASDGAADLIADPVASGYSAAEFNVTTPPTADGWPPSRTSPQPSSQVESQPVPSSPTTVTAADKSALIIAESDPAHNTQAGPLLAADSAGAQGMGADPFA